VEEHRFCYTFYPGSSLDGYELQPA
jgi:hypothetical protein